MQKKLLYFCCIISISIVVLPLITFLFQNQILSMYKVANAKLFGASLISAENSPAKETVLDAASSMAPNTSPIRNPPREEVKQEVVKQNINNQDSTPDDNQEKIDDILEKIDLLKRQLAELEKPAPVQENVLDANIILPDANMVPAGQLLLPASQAQNYPVVNKSGGGVSKPVYPKLVISEVQIGSLANSKQEFVELYNGNIEDVDLTDWYVQRKTKTGSSYATFAPNTLFSAKKITANGYFLIARQGSGLVGDIFIDNPLTEDNSLFLKNPNGEVVDKVGWGAAQDVESAPAPNPPAGQSIGRNADEKDTDNNLADFALDQPTFRAKNLVYVAPAAAASGGGSTVTGTLPPLKIIINELQSEGKTTKDEFIQLYNPNDVAVNVTGFALKKKTASEAESNLVSSEAFSGNIAAQGYFLVAPQKNDDGTESYTGSVAPDLRYSGKTFSFASDNTILLYGNDASLLDKVGFGVAGDFETAVAQNPPVGNSIIRKNGQDTDNNAADFGVKDVFPPERSGGLPAGVLASGATQVDMSIATNENATCKYATAPGQDFDVLANSFLTSDGLKHAATITGLTDGSGYQYYIRCKDVLGNKNADDVVISFSVAVPAAAPLEPPPTASVPPTVVINEIAWMGTVVSANNEWIELFNPSDQAVNLSGWKLAAADGAPTINLSGSIAAHGFYLLERTDDSSVPDVAADQIYTGALGNSGENISLTDAAGNTVDQVNSIPWFAGDNTSKKTMQRKNPLVSGNDAANWQTSQDPDGTPKL